MEFLGNLFLLISSFAVKEVERKLTKSISGSQILKTLLHFSSLFFFLGGGGGKGSFSTGMSVQCFEPVVKYIIKEKWLLIVCFSFCLRLWTHCFALYVITCSACGLLYFVRIQNLYISSSSL